MSRRIALGALVWLSVACSATGVAPSPADDPDAQVVPDSGAPRTVLRVALGRDPVTLDPRGVLDDEGEAVVRALFEPLVDVGTDGSVRGASAERIEVEDEGRTYRFFLRPATFHDGTRVTAHDHARALLAVFDPDVAPVFREDLLAGLRGASRTDPPRAPDAGDDTDASPDRGYGSVADVLAAGGVEVVSDEVLVLRLVRPDARFLAALSDVVLMPRPVVADSDPAGFAERPIGNGPFRMAEARERGAFIRLVASASHRTPPGVDELVFQIYPADPTREARWNDLLEGRLQVTAIPPSRRSEAAARFGRVRSDDTAAFGAATSGAGLFDGWTTSTYAYAFDVTRSPSDDVRFRRAVAAAIDREALAAGALEATVDPASALLSPGLAATPEPCPHCRYDPEYARLLLSQWADAAGIDDVSEVRLSLTYPRGGGHVTIAEQLAGDLESVLGIQVRLQARESGAFAAGVTAGEYAFFRLGLRSSIAGSHASSSLLDPAFRSTASAPVNVTGWRDRATDSALDRLRAGPTEADALAAQTRLVTEAVIVPLLWFRHDLVVSPEVQGFSLAPSGRWWLEDVVLPRASG